MEEYYCTSCGELLNIQEGFDPNKGNWICKNCREQLIGDHFSTGKRYPEVVWYCDCCNEVLNEQLNFDDHQEEWECTCCGHVNQISESAIYNNKQQYENSKAIANLFGAIGALVLILSVKIKEKRSNKEKKLCKKKISLLLCIFLGRFGAHKFYEGKIVWGIIYTYSWIIDWMDCRHHPHYKKIR